MSLETVNYITCPIDRHECTLAMCLENWRTRELLCAGAVEHMANAIVELNKLNFNLSVFDDINDPTGIEIKNSLNIDDLITDVASRLKIDRPSLYHRILQVAGKRLKEDLKNSNI
jgi:hypothetical protein